MKESISFFFLLLLVSSYCSFLQETETVKSAPQKFSLLDENFFQKEAIKSKITCELENGINGNLLEILQFDLKEVEMEFLDGVLKSLLSKISGHLEKDAKLVKCIEVLSTKMYKHSLGLKILNTLVYFKEEKKHLCPVFDLFKSAVQQNCLALASEIFEKASEKQLILTHVAFQEITKETNSPLNPIQWKLLSILVTKKFNILDEYKIKFLNKLLLEKEEESNLDYIRLVFGLLMRVEAREMQLATIKNIAKKVMGERNGTF